MAENTVENENLNNVENLDGAKPEVLRIVRDNAGQLYKNIIKSLSLYSKGELFTPDDVRNLVRNEFETL